MFMKMKKTLLLLLFCGFAATASAQYYIEGFLDGKFNDQKEYEVSLHDPQGHGIYFEPQPVIHGQPASSGQYSFSFRNASTACPSGFIRGLKFYKQDANGNWQIDSEVRSGTATYRSDRSMVIVLVLDCSNSLGSDFANVQNSAIEFIRTLGEKTAYQGNVHIGIVAFNWQNRTIAPMPLTAYNQQKLQNFIRNMHTDYSTRLYSAMDKGLELLSTYLKNNADLENFDGTAMVTFTDGLDNGSQSADKNIVNSEQYYNYLLPIIKNSTIGGRSIESHVVAVMGSDVQANASSFRQKLEALASSPDHYYAGNMARLEQQFVNIAEGLVTRWQDLICYVPTITGNVRWVLECNAPAPQKPKPVKRETIHEVGAVIGNLNGFSYKRIGKKHFSFQLDLGLKFRTVQYYNYNTYGSYSESYTGAALDLNANFMYQNTIKDTRACSIQWFAGGGAITGFAFYWGNVEFGINAIGGVEFLFNKIPFSLQIDARPGLGLSPDEGAFFDYAIGIGLRYFFER